MRQDALALAPGAQANNPADDGLLTLGEIYNLDLRGCELAILSACMPTTVRSNRAKEFGPYRAVF